MTGYRRSDIVRYVTRWLPHFEDVLAYPVVLAFRGLEVYIVTVDDDGPLEAFPMRLRDIDAGWLEHPPFEGPSPWVTFDDTYYNLPDEWDLEDDFDHVDTLDFGDGVPTSRRVLTESGAYPGAGWTTTTEEEVDDDR